MWLIFSHWFFQSKAAPIPPEEALDMFAFMAAADASKAKGRAEAALRTATPRSAQVR